MVRTNAPPGWIYSTFYKLMFVVQEKRPPRLLRGPQCQQSGPSNRWRVYIVLRPYPGAGPSAGQPVCYLRLVVAALVRE